MKNENILEKEKKPRKLQNILNLNYSKVYVTKVRIY
jgi:hypothetical protein